MLLTDERYPVLPFSSAVFLDKSFSPPILPGHLAKPKRGALCKQASCASSGEARLFPVLILQNRGVSGPGACLGVFQGGGMVAGRSDSVSIIHLFYLREMYLYVPT